MEKNRGGEDFIPKRERKRQPLPADFERIEKLKHEIAKTYIRLHNEHYFGSGRDKEEPESE